MVGERSSAGEKRLRNVKGQRMALAGKRRGQFSPAVVWSQFKESDRRRQVERTRGLAGWGGGVYEYNNNNRVRWD